MTSSSPMSPTCQERPEATQAAPILDGPAHWVAVGVTPSTITRTPRPVGDNRHHGCVPTSSRYTHLLHCVDLVLGSNPDEVNMVLERWQPGSTGDQRVTVNSLTKALSALIQHLDDDGFDALHALVCDGQPTDGLRADQVLLGAAAGLTAAEIRMMPALTTDQRDRLTTLAGLRGNHVG